MVTVKKYTRGKLKGWNIRQTKNGKFIAYIGITSQSREPFSTLIECENWIKAKYI